MKYIDKSYRVTSNSSDNANRNFLIANIIQGCVFIAGAFAFFEALCLVCNMIGSIVCSAPYQALDELIRVLPILVVLFGFVFLNNAVHNYTTAKDKKVMRKAVAAIAIGGFALLYVIVGLFTGTYRSIVEGYPTALFPLDFMFLCLAYIGIGIGLIVLKNKQISFEMPECQDNKGKIIKVFDNIFYTIFMMAALFGCAAVIYSTWVVDWAHGHTFFNIMLVLLFLTPVADVALWKYIFFPLKEEYKNPFQVRVGIIVLAINVLIFGLYLIALQNDPSAPNDAAFGILPVEYTASVNASTYIYGIVNLAGPIVAVVKGLVKRK